MSFSMEGALEALKNELIVIRLMAVIMIANAAIVFISLQVTKSPYGRYASSNWGPSINGRAAWFVQELPAFAVPVFLLLFTDGATLSGSANKILLAMFLTHYFQRYVKGRRGYN